MKALKITLIVLAALVLISVGGILILKTATEKGQSSISYETVDMTRVKDGTYTGEAGGGMVYVKVSVAVSDHAIKRIDILEHKNGRGQKAEAVTNVMLAKNTYDVDVVSGATGSSNTIRSAVSKALAKGMRLAPVGSRFHIRKNEPQVIF